MTKLYIFAACVAAIFFAYVAGGKIALEQCRADMATAQSIAATEIQNKIIQTKRDINAETNNLGVRDIRN